MEAEGQRRQDQKRMGGKSMECRNEDFLEVVLARSGDEVEEEEEIEGGSEGGER